MFVKEKCQTFLDKMIYFLTSFFLVAKEIAIEKIGYSEGINRIAFKHFRFKRENNIENQLLLKFYVHRMV